MATKKRTVIRCAFVIGDGCGKVTKRTRAGALKHGWTIVNGKVWYCPVHSGPQAIVPMDDAGRVKAALGILQSSADKPDMFRVRDAIAILKLGYLKPGGAK